MNDKTYTLLTPSARSFFDGMKEEYGDSLLETANEIASRNNTVDAEISLRDLIEARNKMFCSADTLRLRRRIRMSSIALFGGFSYVFLGIVIYISRSGMPMLTSSWCVDHIWLFIILAGMFLMFMPLVSDLIQKNMFYRLWDNDRDFGSFHSSEIIVKMWDVIEQKGFELMQLRGVSVDGDSSVKVVYDFLIHELNSRAFIDSMNEIIDVRNQIVHSQRNIKNEDINRIIKQAQDIINELSDRIMELKSEN